MRQRGNLVQFRRKSPWNRPARLADVTAGKRRRAVPDWFYFGSRLALYFAAIPIPAMLAGLATDIWIAANYTPAKGDCRMTAIIDGDTIGLYCSDSGATKGRFAGFDTPELFSPKCTSEFTRALEAKWKLRSILLSAERISITVSGHDRYGRKLINMRADNQDVGMLMIKSGHARKYDGGARSGWC